MKNKKYRAVFLTAAFLLPLSFSVLSLAGCSGNKPGTYVDATVPDTLDLAARGALAMQGLLNTLNSDADYAPYGSAAFGDGATSYQSDWGDVVNAIIMGRNMSGSTYDQKAEDQTVNGLKKFLASGGVQNNANTLSIGQLALISQYALKPTAEVKKLLDEMSQKHLDSAANAENYAYDYDGPWQDDSGGHGIIGYGENLSVNGAALRAVSTWAFDGESEISRELIMSLGEKYKNYLTLPRLWEAETTPKVVVDADRGRFNGDMSAYASGLLGLLTYARHANDFETQRFVQAAYEYIRDYGLKSIGLFGDICTTSKMTQLAIMLSQSGVGDYWDDAERYLRNEIAEKQITGAEGSGFAGAEGLFFTDSSYPTHISPINQVADIDCTAQAVQAMYAAWRAVVSGDKGMAQVNMLLNRASDLLDVNSYLPYEGKVELNVKTAEAAAVRLPLWVDWSQAAVNVNGTSQAVKRTGQYVMVEGLKTGDTVSITFPVKEWDETFTLLWKEGQPYMKSTDPGEGWRAQAEPDKFTLTFRGYTLVEITPVTNKTGSNPDNRLLYQRTAMRSGTAPMISVKRFVPKTVIPH
ncbi:MAG: hypothetical protein LBH95_08435 [Oscillospiraceae bacterium]|jgi:hypothetical protein|nr:hypothetical protein [Oscillospiraceae bacterium]